MKLNIDYKNPYVITGAAIVIIIVGAMIYSKMRKKKIAEALLKDSAATMRLGGYSGGSGTTSKTSTGGILVTGHDAVWDYLYENGRWYTRKKGATDWIDMQNSLPADNYNLAASRLKKYL